VFKHLLIDQKNVLNFIFKWFSNNFSLYQVKVQKYSCCDTFFFIEWRKIENLNKAGKDSYMLKDC